MARIPNRISYIRKSMSLTSAIVATAVGVLFPVILSSSVGIVALAMGRGTAWTLFGVLVISFAAAAIGGGVIVTVLLSRRHRLARQQADFIANVTHELRTPLTAIRMYAQTIQMGRLDEQPQMLQRSIATILQETEWLETMIDQVLDWRAASRDMDLPEMKDLRIRDTISNAVERFRRMVQICSVDLDVQMTSSKMVRHDPRQMESVVLNLLVNAFKYTGSEKRICLRLEDCENDVCLSVTDNGVGVPISERDRIFEPFCRLDSRLGGKASGVGLGLAIVKHHVLCHVGTVHVEPLEKGGSRFVVRLPAQPETEGTP